MRIAFISYEYPPDTAFGGIATYTFQAARMLRRRGHDVEVFAGSTGHLGTQVEAGVVVHRVRGPDHATSLLAIGRRFAERHAASPFDVLEGPELDAEPAAALRLVPDIPLVIKLHSPSWLLAQLNRVSPQRFGVGARLKSLRSRWAGAGAVQRTSTPARLEDLEQTLAGQADVITAPSRSVGEKVAAGWRLSPACIQHLPNPYLPGADLLDLPVDTLTETVTFVGRLEIRKGVLDLARAIPLILKRRPGTRFRLCGGDSSSPVAGVGMQRYLEEGILRDFRGSVQFLGHVAHRELPDLLAATDVCVFPSIWENFPYVCLEAMAAGRGIVATDSGGMAEMLPDGTGRLIPAKSPDRLSEAVVSLLENPSRRMALGAAARERVLSEYGSERISPLQESCYARAIERRRSLGARRDCA